MHSKPPSDPSAGQGRDETGPSGSAPHRAFDAAWRSTADDDVRASGQNSYLDGASRGRADGRKANHLDVPAGAKQDTWPEWFDGDWYLAVYFDVRDAGIEPYAHYLSHGQSEGRRPNGHNPNGGDAEAETDWFDAEWYLAVNDDVRVTGWEPAEHYAVHGKAEGRAPNAYFTPPPVNALNGNGHGADDASWPGWFDVEFYRRMHPTLEGSALWKHYIERGRGEGAAPNPALHRLAGITVRPPLDPSEAEIARAAAIITHSGVFDVDWYAETHQIPPDECVRHYLLSGAFTGADPNPFFSSLDYLMANPDVADHGYNPLLHYIEFGFGEGRRLSHASPFHTQLTARIWHKGF